MEPTRRPEDEAQLNKTPAEQEEPEYSLEEIMNEFGGWTKREEPKTEPGETVRLATPADRPPDAQTPSDEEAADTIRFAPVHTQKEPEPERPTVWTYQGEPDPEPAAADPKEARERARAERREKRQAEKRRSSDLSCRRRRPAKSVPPSSLSTFFPRWKPRISSILPPPACGCACC